MTLLLLLLVFLLAAVAHFVRRIARDVPRSNDDFAWRE